MIDAGSRAGAWTTRERTRSSFANEEEGIGSERDPRPSGARAEYTEQVLSLVEAVPVGCVTTYGDVAAMVGRGGPRQVGTVMARHGAGVPWWRVVRADGRPAEGLAERALRRLADEGVPVVDGRVRMASARWRPSAAELDAAMPYGSADLSPG